MRRLLEALVPLTGLGTCRARAAAGGLVVTLDVREAGLACGSRSAPDRRLFGLALGVLFSDDERAAVLALAGGPKTALELSRRCGWGESVSTRSKILLANLVDRRVLRVGDDGYELTDPLVAELARR
jgi:hypothetical protein